VLQPEWNIWLQQFVSVRSRASCEHGAACARPHGFRRFALNIANLWENPSMLICRRLFRSAGCALVAGTLAPIAAVAQTPVLRTTLPPVTVTAQKTTEDPRDVPVSVTAVTRDTLEAADVRGVSDAAIFAPNTFFNEFTARKLSNPRFRGVGSSPTNPGVTTYVDGVPQLNANSSSLELLDIDRIEFVRGPLSALYGRNALGGVINVASGRPSLTTWTGSVVAPFGNFGAADVRAAASGPIVADTLAAGLAFGYSRRDGYTINDVTGHDLDSRSAAFGKGQLLWRPAARWEARALVTIERARDGDYALNDVGALRSNAFHASRTIEGHTHRDIVAPTIQVMHSGDRVDFSSVTGFLKWKTDDLTDLDYTALPLATRTNAEEDFQFTEEVRFSSAKAAPIALSPAVSLKWQAGLFVFTQNYTQDAVNSYSPFVVSQFIPFAVAQHTPEAALDDRGVGLYGQGTFTFARKLDIIVGARADREHKAADLNTFYTPTIAPPQVVVADKDFSDVSPQLAVAYHVAPAATVYATAARGFKAGGFNAASPAGAEAYGQEHSWNYEGGVKGVGANGHVTGSVAVFRIDWSDLQVNVPNPFVPAQFFIANAAGAINQGLEVEVGARPATGIDVFAGFGLTHARFSSGSVSNGVAVGGNALANAPDHTVDFGVQYSRSVWRAAALTLRAEVVRYGDYQYDDANTLGQEAYALTNLRGGVRGKRLFVEGWLRNAFDTRYVPIAFPYPGLAASGFVGESGAPRTFGLRLGAMF
jgi:iron complex outermembrane receptor protein